MGEEIETQVLEELNEELEVEQEEPTSNDCNAAFDEPICFSGSGFDQELLKSIDDEIEMSTNANVVVESVLNPEGSDQYNESIVYLEPILTIQHVVKLHEILKQSYASNNKVEINVAQVSSIDTASLQLLVALKKNAVKQQKAITFASPSQRFIESAELLGLLEVLEISV
jgi:anti-anti-sigma regulatory factor